MIERVHQTISLDKTEISRLMCYYDKQLVELTYKIVLDRAPDKHGFDSYLERLRDGESRREIIFQIANSSEAKSRGVNTDLFQFYRIWRKIQRIPVIGSLIIILIALFRIRTVVREFRRIQNAVFGIFQELK